jgi:hypothetical protein
MTTFKVGDHVRVRDDTMFVLVPDMPSDCAGLTGTVIKVYSPPAFECGTIIEYDAGLASQARGAFRDYELELIKEEKSNDNV